MADGLDTPTAILANVATALRESPFDDISYRAIGDAVGVSERTVYRHFPTRSHLLEAVAAWIEERAFPLAPFVTVAQFQTAARARFLAFDSLPAYAFVFARAASLSPTAQPEPTFFTKAIVATLATDLPSLNQRDLRRKAASVRYFASAQFWARMRTSFELSGAEIADVFDRTVAQFLGESAGADSAEAAGAGAGLDGAARPTSRTSE